MKNPDLGKAQFAKAIARHLITRQTPVVFFGARASNGRAPEAAFPMVK